MDEGEATLSGNDLIVSFRAPALGIAAKEYNQQLEEQQLNILRLYYTRIDNALRNNSQALQSQAMGWYMS